MLTHNLGYPRIGSQRELKKACELYWSGKDSQSNLLQVGKNIRTENWLLQKKAGLDLVPCNDFSFYDQVLDMSLTLNAIPQRYHDVMHNKSNTELDLLFAMARGYQKDGLDIIAMEMTKWFDTNYHYIVPEFYKNQQFSFFSKKVLQEFYEAKELGLNAKPVLIGPVSYLLLGKEKEEGFHRIELIDRLLPVYIEILDKLQEYGVQWVQFDEPFLVMNLSQEEKKAYHLAYNQLRRKFPYLNIMVATYFECTGDNLDVAMDLPLDALHVDLVRCPSQLDDILESKFVSSKTRLSLGLVDGRNIWKNDFKKSLDFIDKAKEKLGDERIMIAPSSSLLHSPCDLEKETNDKVLSKEIKNWLAFAKQKVEEVVTLNKISSLESEREKEYVLKENQDAIEDRRNSVLIHKKHVKDRVASIEDQDTRRKSRFSERQEKQSKILNLPLFPSTTIGSFPQT
ncbi:MAG: 5-methyltetrahydropteroyltriglutamate--homocysteine S-methyltransferase, partial [Cytophagaceae bacterium]